MALVNVPHPLVVPPLGSKAVVIGKRGLNVWPATYYLYMCTCIVNGWEIEMLEHIYIHTDKSANTDAHTSIQETDIEHACEQVPRKWLNLSTRHRTLAFLEPHGSRSADHGKREQHFFRIHDPWNSLIESQEKNFYWLNLLVSSVSIQWGDDIVHCGLQRCAV